MRILVMGATGRTGKLFTALALGNGHQVAAIARSPEKLAGLAANIIPGTPYDDETVARAMVGCDAVVNVLNVSRTSDGPWAKLAAPTDMISASCAHVLRAMPAIGCKRYVTLSTVGAGDSWAMMPLPLRWLVQASNLRYAFADHTAEEALLNKADVDHTIARAALLNDKPDAGIRVVKPGEKMRSSISRHTVAAFILKILEQRLHLRETVHISRA